MHLASCEPMLAVAAVCFLPPQIWVPPRIHVLLSGLLCCVYASAFPCCTTDIAQHLLPPVCPPGQVLDATKAYKKLLTDKKDVEGLPESGAPSPLP